jgi:hypothetical protein
VRVVAIPVLAAVIALVLARCGGDETTTTIEALNLSEKDEIEQVGNEWAPLFAQDDSGACDYMFAQPVCEKFYGPVGGEPAEVGRPSGFQESFVDARVERVEIKGHKAEAEFSNGEPVEFIQETDQPRDSLGDWFILEP